MATADAKLAWLRDFVESWIVRAEAEKYAMPVYSEHPRPEWLEDFAESWAIRAEAEKRAMPECSERIRLDGELSVLRVIRGMIVGEAVT